MTRRVRPSVQCCQVDFTMLFNQEAFMCRHRRRGWGMQTSVQYWRASSLEPKRPERMHTLWRTSTQRIVEICCETEAARLMYSRMTQ